MEKFQRAASNAYTWWWTSHLKTKQGKWLRHGLDDMEEKVDNILKVIEEDADSFGKRAEMYYKKRPELINFVQESYKAYRALADRYEHISGELQNANNTIAKLFPEKVQLAMEELDDDDENPPPPPPLPKPPSRINNPAKVPKPPENPKFKTLEIKDMKKTLPPKENKSQEPKSSTNNPHEMSKDEAHEKIDKLQKEILVLQTEKEFVKSCYENGQAKFWDIEKQIVEIQEKKIRGSQDDSGASDAVIIQDKDDIDQAQMTTTSALRSSGDDVLLDQSQEHQDKSTKEARVEESERAKDAKEKLKAFKARYLKQKTFNQEVLGEPETTEYSSSENLDELQSTCEKVIEYFEKTPTTSSHTVVELAETVDGLVNKALSLESAASSQNALIERLRSEIDELRKHLQILDKDETLPLTNDSKNLSDEVREPEEKLQGIQDLNQSVEEQSNEIETDSTETFRDDANHSDELQTHGNKDEIENVGVPPPVEERTILNSEQPHESNQEQEDRSTLVEDSIASEDKAFEVIDDKVQGIHQDLDLEKNADQKNKDEIANVVVPPLAEEHTFLNAEQPHVSDQEQEDRSTLVEDSMASKDEALELDDDDKVQGIQVPDLDKNADQKDHSQPDADAVVLSINSQDAQEDETKDKNSTHADQDSVPNVELHEEQNEETGNANRKSVLLNGLEERERIILREYMSILQNYKETKRMLSEIEKRKEESLYKVMDQIQELQSDNDKKDMEIQALKEKLSSIIQATPDENMNSSLKIYEDSQNTRMANRKVQWKYMFNEFQKKRASRVMPRLLEDLLKERNIDFATRSKQLLAMASMKNPTEDDVKQVIFNEEPRLLSAIEEKFRRDIDAQLEENLEFWLRWSTASHQIQNFQRRLRDLQEEFSQPKKDNKKKEAGAPDATDPAMKSEEAPGIEKKLREFHGELTVWLEQRKLLRNELKYKFSSLCKIQEEISTVSKLQPETEEEEFSSELAARYGGEVMNMRQENKKVAEELQAGLDLVRRIQLEIEKTLSKSNVGSVTSGSKCHPHRRQQNERAPTNKNKVPLRNFLFGSKNKKSSIFSCMGPPNNKQNEVQSGGRLHM